MSEMDIKNLLKIDSKKEQQNLIDFIQKGVKKLGREGAVIGLSGGLDSSTCAYLLEKALGKDKILALILPERDSSYHAWVHNYIVAGTLDKSEGTIGVYDEHGDGACDILLLRHLYKTQIRQLARDLGVPTEITQKPSSADLYGNLPWEKVLGFTYEQLDQVLCGMERGYERTQLIQFFGKELVEGVENWCEQGKFKKSIPLSSE